MGKIIRHTLALSLALFLMGFTMVGGQTFNLARTPHSKPLTQVEQAVEWIRVALGGEERKVYTESASMFPVENAEDSLFWRGVAERIQ